MMMTEPWYEVVSAKEALSQGDLIRNCQMLSWRKTADSGSLADWAEEGMADVVVMTQACDLEHHKVENVVLCRILGLTSYRSTWTERMQMRNQNPSEKSWKRTLEDIAGGIVWNESLLAQYEHPDAGIEIQVVEFQNVLTIPRTYLEGIRSHPLRIRSD